MIRCPSCGQRTLDVASACPKCGHVLLQNPLEMHAWNDLVSCRRCGKHIEREVVECPFCGYQVRRGRRRRRTVLAVVGVAVVAGASYAAVRAGYVERLRPARPTAVQGPGPDSESVATAPAEVSTAPPIVVAPPPAASSASAVPPSPAPIRNSLPARRPPEEAVTGTLQRRWTVEWANVREGRGIDTPVVLVLAPGRQVDVADMRNGWWALYEGGAVRGYIANSVLAARPPTVGP